MLKKYRMSLTRVLAGPLTGRPLEMHELVDMANRNNMREALADFVTMTRNDLDAWISYESTRNTEDAGILTPDELYDSNMLTNLAMGVRNHRDSQGK
jgi:hypothetical protein